MARIRSVHPGLFTDEAFISLSADAQVLLIGIWTEADDNGVFEWKPITLRMRLRPTKDGPIEPLLSELEAANCVRKYESGGRHYGAIRNFRRFQRPKFPKSLHTITDDIRSYVGLTAVATEIDGDDEGSIPRNGEMSPQMERRGEEEVEKGKKDHPEKKQKQNLEPRAKPNGKSYAVQLKTIRLTDADFARWEKSFPNLSLRAELESLDAWAGKQDSWFQAVAGALAKREREVVTRLASERQARASPALPLSEPVPPKDDAEAEKRLNVGRDKKRWPRDRWGPAPNEPGCLIPEHLIQPTDKGWAEWSESR